jgi:hypothetical protein
MRAAKQMALAAGVAIGLGGIASADTVQSALTPLVRPAAETVTLPALPLPFTEKDRSAADDYFYFHKNGVGYETAFADLDVCRLYTETAVTMIMPPKFVPLGGDVVVREVQTGYPWHYQQYGLVGGLLIDYFAAIAQRDNAHATMRRCMAYKGYKRYAVSEKIRESLDSGTPAEKIAKLALIASGPAPQAGEVGQ